MNDKTPQITSSEGGLATGLKTIHEQSDTLWIGWPGIAEEEVNKPQQKKELENLIHEKKCEPVWLKEKDVNAFYNGFSNQVLWPLFHYFPEYVHFNDRTWQAYKHVNRKFADKILEHTTPDDLVWVHDYHLMLVPDYLRRVYSDLKIGFFLHIPFPSCEVFKILPVRERILNGLLGSDLIGFHTFDYQRHFINTVQKLSTHEVFRNVIRHQEHTITVDVFPMGIDVDKFENAAKKHLK